MATALYRRYRPETFADMIGQAHVTEPLMAALRGGRVGHAYLFSGPRGCGKTTSARVLARCLNCASGPSDTPCGTCPSCLELSRDGGGSLDVVEIDAASHGGVDDARDLRERAVFAPARDRYKIFIIDEAHMVTSGGFNALLKIVEEPPPHIKFIFATTEPEKVISTIRSRTHHYPFRLIAPGALVDYTQQLCEQEGVAVEPGVLPLVVRAGGGSVRDTLSILDQLIAGSEDGRVSLTRATGLLGFTSSELIDEVVRALAVGDAAAAFRAVDRVIQTGQDPSRFVEDLLQRLRDLIVITATTVDGATAVFHGVPEDQLQRMFDAAQSFDRGRLSRIADTVATALDTMSGATAPQLHLELLIARTLLHTGGGAPASGSGELREVRPVALPAQVSTAQPEATNKQHSEPQPSQHQPAAAVPQPPVSAPAAATPIDVIATMRSAREVLKTGATEGNRPLITPAEAPTAPNLEPESPDVSAPNVELNELLEVWPQLLEELLESDREAWEAVHQVQPLHLEGDVLTIGISSKSDLDVFKARGAEPLRETILGAIGINVRYAPRRVQASAPHPPAGREPAQSDTPQHNPHPEPVPHNPYPETAPDLKPEPEPDLKSEPEPDLKPEPEPGPPPTASPTIPQRYGEAVIREVLGAKLIERRPLPSAPEA